MIKKTVCFHLMFLCFLTVIVLAGCKNADDATTNLEKKWTRLLGVDGASTQGKDIYVDSDGNIYITGYTTGNLDGQVRTGSIDVFVIKYDSSGVKQWTRLLGDACTY